MRAVKRFAFPLSLIVIHGLITIAVFVQAMRDPTRSGLLPILVFTIDLPASWMIMSLARTIGVTSDSAGYDWGLLNDMTFFLILGSLWWFLIGYAISKIFTVAKSWIRR